MSGVVLLVEDNDADVELTLRALSEGNLINEVVVARDGDEAARYLFATPAQAGEEIGDPPALVLLDLDLPTIDGLELLRRIRADERTRILPVVILTSSSREEDMVRSYALGANAYVQKPVDFVAFVSAARALGLFWLLHNEPPPPWRAGP